MILILQVNVIEINLVENLTTKVILNKTRNPQIQIGYLYKTLRLRKSIMIKMILLIFY